MNKLIDTGFGIYLKEVNRKYNFSDGEYKDYDILTKIKECDNLHKNP